MREKVSTLFFGVEIVPMTGRVLSTKITRYPSSINDFERECQRKRPSNRVYIESFSKYDLRNDGPHTIFEKGYWMCPTQVFSGAFWFLLGGLGASFITFVLMR